MMTGKDTDNILYVRMFGEFSVMWNGRKITGGSGAGDTQFGCILQYLIHNRGERIDRSILEELLFAGREIQDRGHAMRSIVYNARKKLRSACLPEAEYIRRRGSAYEWTGELRVEEDASRMELLCREMETQNDPARRLELCLEACHCYKGEFLEQQTRAAWAEKEARRYRELFCSCMEEAVKLLRGQKDYIRMESLGLHAAKVHPLADWETVTMEALAASGRVEDARKFYDDTVSFYFQEQGMRPSRRLTGLLQRLGDQMGHPYAVFDEIQEELSESREEIPGGYVCTWPVFEGIYRMMVRMLERNGQSIYLMLCTVVDSKGNPVQEGAVLEQLSGRLCEAIRYSVRRSDAVNQYGKGQYLVLLFNTTRENCRLLQRRINSRFQVRRQRIGVQYRVRSVLCTPEMKRRIMN